MIRGAGVSFRASKPVPWVGKALLSRSPVLPPSSAPLVPRAPLHTCGDPWNLELKEGNPHKDGGPVTLLYVAALVDHIQDLAHPGGAWRAGKGEVSRAEGRPLPVAQDRSG